MTDENSDHALIPADHSAPLAVAGSIANQAAATAIFARHRQELTANSRRAQLADLVTFATYLHAGHVPLPLPPREAWAATLDLAGLAPTRVAHLQTLSDDDLQLHVAAAQFASVPSAWSGLSWGLVAGFVQWQLAEGFAIATVNRRLSTVKTYADLAFQAGMLTGEQITRIRSVRSTSGRKARNLNQQRALQRVGHKKADVVELTVDQALVLKQQPDTPQGWRDALLVCLLLDLGLRVSELAALPLSALDTQAGTLTFYRQKVDLVQTHRLSDDASYAAQRYLAHRGLSPGWLFYGSHKNTNLVSQRRMSTRAIYGRIALLGQRLGINALGPHDGRHHWATLAVAGGSDLRAVMDAGGWKSPAMPLRYARSGAISNAGITRAHAERTAYPSTPPPEPDA